MRSKLHKAFINFSMQMLLSEEKIMFNMDSKTISGYLFKYLSGLVWNVDVEYDYGSIVLNHESENTANLPESHQTGIKIKIRIKERKCIKP